MNPSERISELIERKRELFVDVSNRIWEYAETRFEEYRSAESLSNTLEKEGFAVERGVGELKPRLSQAGAAGVP
ncbi:hypothetical protein LJK88_35800 [Paenibacillus sp. P26]|nr:hypothetical protein LJK88_35800 [Paenibacillus sp. P26]